MQPLQQQEPGACSLDSGARSLELVPLHLAVLQADEMMTTMTMVIMMQPEARFSSTTGLIDVQERRPRAQTG